MTQEFENSIRSLLIKSVNSIGLESVGSQKLGKKTERLENQNFLSAILDIISLRKFNKAKNTAEHCQKLTRLEQSIFRDFISEGDLKTDSEAQNLKKLRIEAKTAIKNLKRTLLLVIKSKNKPEKAILENLTIFKSDKTKKIDSRKFKHKTFNQFLNFQKECVNFEQKLTDLVNNMEEQTTLLRLRVERRGTRLKLFMSTYLSLLQEIGQVSNSQ